VDGFRFVFCTTFFALEGSKVSSCGTGDGLSHDNYPYDKGYDKSGTIEF
jgi:hypothetical protein